MLKVEIEHRLHFVPFPVFDLILANNK